LQERLSRRVHSESLDLANADRPRPKIPYFAIPVLLGLIALFEAWHFVPFFRLLTFIAVFLLLANIAWLARGNARDIFLMLASLAFGLVVVEGVAYTMMRGTYGTAAYRGAWSPGQPIIGWGPAAPGKFHDFRIAPNGATVYDATYTIDRNLLRKTLSCQKGPAVVFFGCSFTFGDGVNDNQTLPQNFADLIGRKTRVLNLGFTGYGPQQFLREEQTGRFDKVIGTNPKLFVFLTAVWHAERTACKAYWTPRAPRYALKDGKLVHTGACNPTGPSLWFREWLENTAAYRMFIEPYRQRLTHDDIDLYVRILAAAVQLGKEKYHTPTIVLYLRSDPRYFRGNGFSDDAIMQRLRDAGAIVVDATLLKEKQAGARLNIVGDGHPTPYANKLRASLLKTYLEKHAPDLLCPAAAATCKSR
jgi:hypothetical protein